MKKTKVICTIGPASSSIEILKKLVNAGMDCARINTAHGNIGQYQKIIQVCESGDLKREAFSGAPFLGLKDWLYQELNLAAYDHAPSGPKRLAEIFTALAALELALQRLEVNDPSAALDIVSKVRSKFARTGAVLSVKGLALLGMGDPKAGNVLAEAHTADPLDARIWAPLIQALNRGGHRDRAAGLLKKMKVLKPLSQQIYTDERLFSHLQ